MESVEPYKFILKIGFCCEDDKYFKNDATSGLRSPTLELLSFLLGDKLWLDLVIAYVIKNDSLIFSAGLFLSLMRI